VRGTLRVAAGIAAVASLLPPTSAAAARAAIDSPGRLAPSGRVVHLTGSLVCGGCGVVRIGVTLSQKSTGALAQGGIRCRCSGGTRQMTIRAVARYGTFAPGRAKVCAWLVSSGSEAAGSAIQWCRPMRLVL
jgi:hypothetical protein